MATTPKKESEFNCCICLSQNTCTFKLNGRKLSSENFERELSLLLQDDCLVSKLKCADAGVCRNCHNKVKGKFDFIQQVRYSCMSFLNEPFHVKRTMPSPLTPKSMQGCKTVNPTTVSTDTVHVVQPKSRKRLKFTFESSTVKCQNTTPSHDITTFYAYSVIRAWLCCCESRYINGKCWPCISTGKIYMRKSYKWHRKWSSISSWKFFCQFFSWVKKSIQIADVKNNNACFGII